MDAQRYCKKNANNENKVDQQIHIELEEVAKHDIEDIEAMYGTATVQTTKDKSIVEDPAGTDLRLHFISLAQHSNLCCSITLMIN